MPLPQYLLSLATAAGVIALILELLRRRQLREKYAVLWLLVGFGIFSFTAFPPLLGWVAGAARVEIPINLLFFVAIILLLAVTMHLSWESSRLEERTRLLAEEVALLRSAMESLEAESGPSAESRSSGQQEQSRAGAYVPAPRIGAPYGQD